LLARQNLGIVTYKMPCSYPCEQLNPILSNVLLQTLQFHYCAKQLKIIKH